MLAIIILMIIAIVLGGFAAYQLYTVTQTQNLLIQSQKNLSTIALWKTMLVSKARAVGYENEIVLPYGTNINNIHSLPKWIYFNTKNAWGKEIVYCPFATTHSGTTNSTVQTSASTSYNVEIKTNFATVFNDEPKPYVIASSKLNGVSSDVLAFLISPTPSVNNVLPTCETVTFDNNLNTFTAPNGLVETITKGDVETFANLAMLNGVSGITGNSTNTYNNKIEGDDSVNGNTLYQNFNYISGSGIQQSHLYLPSGISKVSDFTFNLIEDTLSSQKTVLVIEGASDGSSVISADTYSTLTFNNFKVILKNVKIDSKVNLVLHSSNLVTDTATLSSLGLFDSVWKINGNNDTVEQSANASSIEAFKSEIYISSGKRLILYDSNANNASIKLTMSSLIIENSELVINKTRSQNVGATILLFNSKIKTINAILTTIDDNDYSNDIFVDSTSELSLYNSLLSVSGHAKSSIYSNGSVTFTDSDLRNGVAGNVGIVSSFNSSLVIMSNQGNSSYIGNPDSSKRLDVAVLDNSYNGNLANGAKYMGGAAADGSEVILYAKTACGYGTIFTYSNETLKIAANTQNAYASIVDENIKNIISKINTSNWLCVK